MYLTLTNRSQIMHEKGRTCKMTKTAQPSLHEICRHEILLCQVNSKRKLNP